MFRPKATRLKGGRTACCALCRPGACTSTMSVEEAGSTCITEGFASPVHVLDLEQARACHAQLQEYEQLLDSTAKGDHRFKVHLLLPWAWDLVHHPVIVQLAKACLQTNDVWCWSTDLNIKEPHSETHYTWHQDSTYAGISPSNAAVTIWLALTESGEESGCVKCIPRSHQFGQIPPQRRRR